MPDAATATGPLAGRTGIAHEAVSLTVMPAMARFTLRCRADDKTALAGLAAGGGKVVVLDHPEMRRAAAFRALGRHIQSRGGQFFTSGDFGTTAQDLAGNDAHAREPAYR